MTDQMKAFIKAWGETWAEEPGSEGRREGTREPLPLEDTPAYPLARTVQMPPGHPYETGALSFRMFNLALHGVSRLDESLCAQEAAGDRARMKLVLEQVVLRGRYAVEAKPDPIIELDTGGNLQELPPHARTPTVAGADPDGADGNGSDPQTEAWLDQARNERQTLSQTPNGQMLLSLYDTHNEVYDYVFRNNQALPQLWQAGGATKAMAADTSDAIANNTVINASNKTYDTGQGSLTYNENAFIQQLNVAVACVYTDPDFNEETGPNMQGPYWAAAKAAISFGKGVNSATNNTKSNVNEMSASDVHNAVNSYQGDLPEVTDEEMTNILFSQGSPGGAAPSTGAACIALDEEDRKRIRYIYEATMKQRAEDAAIVGKPLFEGTCEAKIPAVEAEIEFGLEEGPGGLSARALSARVELPAFELDIDDSGWVGDAGGVARSRIERMYFIRSLLHDSVVARLRQSLIAASERAYNRALGAARKD